MSRSIPSISRQTVEEKAYLVLRREILQGRLAGGQRLVQDELAQQLGTSRIPVRAALQRLESSGLVLLDPKGFYTVASFSAADIAEIYGLRMQLEPYAARLAVPRMTDEIIARLESLDAAMNEAAARGDADQWSEYNRDFHMQLYEVSGQQRLLRIIRDLSEGRPSFSPIKAREGLYRSAEEHRAMLEAARTGDAQGLEALVHTHIQQAGARWQHMLASRSARDDDAG